MQRDVALHAFVVNQGGGMLGSVNVLLILIFCLANHAI
jgi:hypothetical protein